MKSRERRLPDFLVIGAMKSGTTSLHRYLDLHPEIGMSKVKELDFFTEEGNWSKGLDWYSAQLPCGAKVVGESSTSYSKFPIYKGVPARIRSVVPRVKLIYIVRDPIERIGAALQQWRELGFGPACPEDALRDFIETSRYYLQIERYLEHFPRSSLLVISSESLRHDRARVLREVHGFLGVDTSFTHPEHEIVHDNFELRLFLRECEMAKARLRGEKYAERIFAPDKPVEGTKPRLSPKLRARILEELAPDTERLQDLLGLAKPPWQR